MQNGHSSIEYVLVTKKNVHFITLFVGLAYYQGKDIVFRFIIEYSSLRDFGHQVTGSIFIRQFLKDDVLVGLKLETKVNWPGKKNT
jgi:hypothetical protein